MTERDDLRHRVDHSSDKQGDDKAARLLKAWQTPTGWRYGSAVNNSEVVLWYTVTSLAFFLFGGLLALLMRVQLATPENDFSTADQHNQIFTMHGSIMMFLFAVPILEAISILLLPEMMGAGDPETLVAEGRKLLEEGSCALKIASCVDCRGPGKDPDKAYPRLVGQPATSVTGQLKAFRKRVRGGGVDAPDC